MWGFDESIELELWTSINVEVQILKQSSFIQRVVFARKCLHVDIFCWQCHMLTKTPVLTLGAEPFGSRIQCWPVLIRMGPKAEMMFGTKQATVQQNATETKWKWVKRVAENGRNHGNHHGNSWNLTAAYCGMSGIAGSSQADKPRLGRVVLWRRLDFSHIPDWAQSLRAWWPWAHGPMPWMPWMQVVQTCPNRNET